MRQILLKEPVSNLSVRCNLLDEKAPLSAEFIWQLAQRKLSFDALHAIWTGPELSCPLPASVLPSDMTKSTIPAENATSFPSCGDLVLASLASRSVKGLPPGNFFDIGVFYGDGARMLMPFGWIMVNVCATIVPEDLAQAKSSMKAIQRNGACKLFLEPV